MRSRVISLITRHHFLIAVAICVVYILLFSILSIVRHNNFGSFGYDLGINDQVVWRYSTFQVPITTSDPFPDEAKWAAHVELTYALIAPLYWLWSDARMLLLAQVFFVVIGGIPIYFLAQKYRLTLALGSAVLIAYLTFYGVQNALWFDAHSASFAAAFLPWFIYFLDRKKSALTIVFLLLAILSKENIGLLTCAVGAVYLWKRRDTLSIFVMAVSFIYVGFIYLVYFPHIINKVYLYQNQQGILSNLNPLSMIDSADKRQAIFYSLASFGFIPILFPIYLIPFIADLATYFVLASDLTASHGLFMHYRVTVAPLLAWAVIMTVARFKKLNSIYIAGYLLICTIAVQYILHLPLSYVSKTWFWTEPSGAANIRSMLSSIPRNASVAAQNNLIPHISHRDKIYTLYPETRTFLRDSPCQATECDWFRWHNRPAYLAVDTSGEWDTRHYLIDRDRYLKGLENLERAGIIEVYKRYGNAVLYTVKKPLPTSSSSDN